MNIEYLSANIQNKQIREEEKRFHSNQPIFLLLSVSTLIPVVTNDLIDDAIFVSNRSVGGETGECHSPSITMLSTRSRMVGGISTRKAIIYSNNNHCLSFFRIIKTHRPDTDSCRFRANQWFAIGTQHQG